MNLQTYKQNLEAKAEQPKPQSQRAYWIDLTAKMLHIPFKSVLYKTINWKQEWIEQMYLHCNRVDNPPRLWHGLVKKSKKEK